MTHHASHTIHRHQHHFGWDNTIAPVVTTAPGDTLNVDCSDSSDGQLTPTSIVADVAALDFGRINPVVGPIWIDGAEPGDAIKVTIGDFTPSGFGWTANIPGFGRMVRFIVGMLAMISSLATPAIAADGDRRTFVIKQFKLENGTVLPEARVMYATYGTLNAAHDNAVLLPSHYMADSHGYEWLIGPDKALDPRKYFLIATELFGNGKSSSPSNTPVPFDGPRFPVTSIRDNVAAVHRLLDEALGVHHLRAIVGFSMGGEQAFQWAVSHPGFADRIVVTSATAKAWPHGIVRLESQIMAIQNDPAFAGGDYKTPPKAGLQTFGAIWAGWLFSQGWWREELWRAGSPPGTTFRTVFEGLYKDFVPGGDANDLILQMRTWEGHDIGTTPGMGGDVKRALASITVPVLYMPSATDLYFPVDDARYEAGFMPHVTLLPIPSLWGHTAGAASNPADAKFLNDHIGAFMRAGDPTR